MDQVGTCLNPEWVHVWCISFNLCCNLCIAVANYVCFMNEWLCKNQGHKIRSVKRWCAMYENVHTPWLGIYSLPCQQSILILISMHDAHNPKSSLFTASTPNLPSSQQPLSFPSSWTTPHWTNQLPVDGEATPWPHLNGKLLYSVPATSPASEHFPLYNQKASVFTPVTHNSHWPKTLAAVTLPSWHHSHCSHTEPWFLHTKHTPPIIPSNTQQGKHKCLIGPLWLHSIHDQEPGL
jgi:hypothetical protein